jgi:hypothetical protein
MGGVEEDFCTPSLLKPLVPISSTESNPERPNDELAQDALRLCVCTNHPGFWEDVIEEVISILHTAVHVPSENPAIYEVSQ